MPSPQLHIYGYLRSALVHYITVQNFISAKLALTSKVEFLYKLPYYWCLCRLSAQSLRHIRVGCNIPHYLLWSTLMHILEIVCYYTPTNTRDTKESLCARLTTTSGWCHITSTMFTLLSQVRDATAVTTFWVCMLMTRLLAGATVLTPWTLQSHVVAEREWQLSMLISVSA